MDKSVEDLLMENQKLRDKLAPGEDKNLTAKLTLKLNGQALPQFERTYAGKLCIVVEAPVLWELLFGTEPNVREVRDFGLSLQASLWERGAISGRRVYYMTKEEYDEQYGTKIGADNGDAQGGAEQS